MRIPSDLLSAALATAVLSAAAFAHGGTYALPSGGGTGGPCGPMTPCTPSRRLVLGPESVGPVRGRPAPAAASRPNRRDVAREAAASWRMWWEWNEARLLRLRRSERLPDSRPAGREAADDGVLAALRGAFSDPWWMASTGARVAYGKLAVAGGSADVVDRLVHDLLRGDPAYDRLEIREASAVALAAMDAVAAVPALIATLRDSASARIRGRNVPNRVRAIAAVALGDLASRAAGPPRAEALAELLRVVAPSAGDPIRCGAIAGLGLLGDRAAVPTLVAVLADSNASDVVRAHAAVALGRLGGPGASAALVAAIAPQSDTSSSHVACAVATALGALGDAADSAAVEAACAAASGAADSLVRRFATYALGELSSPVAEATLLELVRRERGEARDAAVAAIGLFGLKNSERRTALGDGLDAALRDAPEVDPPVAALAFGLLDREQARGATARTLVVCRNAEERGYYALALALHRAPLDGAARAVVRADARTRLDPDLRLDLRLDLDLDLDRRAAKALAHGGDAEGLPAAIDFVRQGSDNLTALFDVAGACARRGGASALLAMLRAPRDAAPPEYIRDNTRAAAAVGLGLAGERLVPTLRERIRTHAYYGAADEASAALSLYY
jgi:hypothetical protein